MKNLYKALAAFQQDVPVIHKGTSGYGYSYADLPTIFEVINPLLKKHGLGFTQLVQEDGVKTIVFHIVSGEQIESITPIPQGVKLAKMNEFQVLGSAITYIRRYALSSILCLVSDVDLDANGAINAAKAVEKEWFNENSTQWNAMLDSLAKGNKITLAQIKAKYKVSKETEGKLKQILK